MMEEIAERGVNVMLFRKNPEKMTALERLEYLGRKLGTRFMAPMFKEGYRGRIGKSIWRVLSLKFCEMQMHLSAS
jgi:hypothetical protein